LSIVIDFYPSLVNYLNIHRNELLKNFRFTICILCNKDISSFLELNITGLTQQQQQQPNSSVNNNNSNVGSLAYRSQISPPVQRNNNRQTQSTQREQRQHSNESYRDNNCISHPPPRSQMPTNRNSNTNTNQPMRNVTNLNSSSNQTVCNCNVDAQKLQVRKEGPNKGRYFFTCQTKACDFFLWAPGDAETSSNNNDSYNGGGGGGGVGASGNRNLNQSGFATNESNGRVCDCGVELKT
jgi:hypothetical protein